MSPDVLAEMLADGRSEARRKAFEAARRSRAGAEDGADLTAVLAWNRRVQALFGERPPSTRPWRGENFRL